MQENQDHSQEVWFSLRREGSDLTYPTDVICVPGVHSNATNGVDFKFQSDIPLTFHSGEVEVSGVVTVLPDSEREGTEVLYLVMTPPFSGRTGSPHILEVIILDSSHGELSIAIAHAQASKINHVTMFWAKIVLYSGGETASRVVLWPCVSSLEEACFLCIISIPLQKLIVLVHGSYGQIVFSAYRHIFCALAATPPRINACCLP